MGEICSLLSIKQLTTTPYRPQCNGLVERFNATLKSMLKKLVADRPKDRDRDRYISAALFAYREAPRESLGFSPFHLLFGRPVRGLMTILCELWTKEIEDEEVKTTYQYVVDLKERLRRSSNWPYKISVRHHPGTRPTLTKEPRPGHLILETRH
ncbi:Gag-Pol polyprotein [Plakobranchus ocellatus]|uniref:Gag-Pol polyprotein n=1 Tax=Plakobranchus ocellatus TaxID=259542 RepID=A0AAV4BJZ1_9GAST|nr:Gag-Pol polyprotein [Plakobranchus ocellatus]